SSWIVLNTILCRSTPMLGECICTYNRFVNTSVLSGLGDCWFLVALQALTLHEDIMSRVVPRDQSFTEKYAGIFQFWFWHFGKWVLVVTDDHLPVNDAGQLVFVSSTCKNLFWGALLEKSYAELCGSYEDLQFGQVSEAFVDFTGGVIMTINQSEAPGNLWHILSQATTSRTLIGCQAYSGHSVPSFPWATGPPSNPDVQTRVVKYSWLLKRRDLTTINCQHPTGSLCIQFPTTEDGLENGLVDGRAYTLTGILKVTYKYGPEYLVKLPWGKMEWKGVWSDSSSTGELLSPKEKILLLQEYNDGEFWMTLRDFKAYFVLLVIGKLNPGLLGLEVGQKWMYTMREGQKRSTTGGWMESPQDTFWKNLQFLLSWRPEEGRESQSPCSTLVSLLQKPRHRRHKRKPHLAIGFFPFRVGSPGTEA
uniref:Calpain catalytic domain-containing protein n=1 Tax=Cavia porcellus TaxID=10141 RepID=H0W0U4_CAVPO